MQHKQIIDNKLSPNKNIHPKMTTIPTHNSTNIPSNSPLTRSRISLIEYIFIVILIVIPILNIININLIYTSHFLKITINSQVKNLSVYSPVVIFFSSHHNHQLVLYFFITIDYEITSEPDDLHLCKSQSKLLHHECTCTQL